MLSSGSFIGNYRIVSQLSDKFGRPRYTAEDMFDSTLPVVISVWQTGSFSTIEQHTTLLQEAQALVKLQHPSILSLKDASLHQGLFYTALPHSSLKLTSLRDRINTRRQSKHPFTSREVLTLIGPIGQALSYAHQQGITHRQLTPDRVLLTDEGSVLVSDFALTGLPTGQDEQHFYMAPEQRQGMSSEASDQYALACIAYELFTGEQPLQPPAPPRQICPELPPSIERALLKALAQEPTDRFSSVADFINALGFKESPELGVNAEPAEASKSVKVQAGTFQARNISSGSRRGVIMKNRKRLAFIGIALVLLILLPLLGYYALTIIPAASAVVTLTPTSKHLTKTYTIDVVTGTPGPGEVQGYIYTATTPVESMTVQTTGHQDRTSAQGNVTVTLEPGIPPPVSLGGLDLSITSNSGVHVTIHIPAPGPPLGIPQTYPASADQAGASGNIPAYDINGYYGDSYTTYFLQNTAPFTGGQDAFDFVQQSDFDQVTSALQQKVIADAQAKVSALAQPGQQAVSSPDCTYKVSTNHHVNDHAGNVTAKGTAKCKGVYFSPADVINTAKQELQSDGSTQLGQNYVVDGNIIAASPQQVSSTQNSAGTFSVHTNSIWTYQFSTTQLQQISQLIAGKPQSSAADSLHRQTGVSQINISTSGIGMALPSASENIKIRVTPVKGL